MSGIKEQSYPDLINILQSQLAAEKERVKVCVDALKEINNPEWLPTEKDISVILWVARKALKKVEEVE